jgi:hypothetical protein
MRSRRLPSLPNCSASPPNLTFEPKAQLALSHAQADFRNETRGLAFLRLKKGAEAAAEFQKIADHKGANWGPLYPLSYIGLARREALGGDTARARKAYEEFFTLWKDADPEIPLLEQARAEYAKLQ